VIETTWNGFDKKFLVLVEASIKGVVEKNAESTNYRFTSCRQFQEQNHKMRHISLSANERIMN
jgi:hypothetical protein